MGVMVCNQYIRAIFSFFLQVYLLLCWITSDILVTVRLLANAGQLLVGQTEEEMGSHYGHQRRPSWMYRIIEGLSSLDRKYFVTITWSVLTFNVMIVFIQMYSAIMEGNPLYPINQYYSNTMSPSDKAKLLEITRDFVNAMDRNNITYIMYGGTLLGSWRHHGLVPWDDDVDFLLNNSQRERAISVMQNIAEKYSIVIRPTAHDPICLPLTKFYIDNKDRTVDGLKVWPFLDLFWFGENETHVWDCDPWFTRYSIYLKSDIFPLQRRPFVDMMLPAPCNTLSVLEQFYNVEICSAHPLNHVYNFYKPYFKIRTTYCERLYNYFPFVFREETPTGVNETLRIGEYMVHSRLIPYTKCYKRTYTIR